MEYPQRKLHRLTTWDYSQNGYYHITICTKGKRNLLCSIRQEDTQTWVIPTRIGEIVKDNWEKPGEIYPQIRTDYFCLMPNHIHGIIIIENTAQRKPVDLAAIVRGYKSVTTRAFNQLVPECEKNTLWQSSYYDEIIRDEEMLSSVRNYISGNPSKWLEDKLFIE